MRNILKFAFIVAMLAFGSVCKAQNVEEIIESLKKEYAPDARVVVWEVKASKDGEKWILSGKMDCASNKRVLLEEMERQGVAYVDRIQLLDEGWAMVRVSVASMRTQGRHAAEMATQALMGTPIRVLEKAGEWYRVQTPDNYIAYIPSSLITMKTAKQLSAWRNARRVVVTAYQSVVLDSPSNAAGVVSDLVLGNILEYKSCDNEWTEIVIPDGRVGFVKNTDITDLDEWSQQNFDADLIINTAKRMLGTGYLWGGTSTKLADCSGLTKVCYFANAIILQRDASQQALTGTRIKADEWESKAKKGDLLFWGTKSGRVTHVGLYIADGMYIHCSGMVKCNSLDSRSQLFLNTPFLSISRIDGNVDTRGIVAVRSHPWYF